MHHKLDYEVLAKIGEGLGMKIGCAIVLGEWDKDNILRGVPYVTYDVNSGTYTKNFGRLSTEKFRRHIELFYEIYNSWGQKRDPFLCRSVRM